MSDMLKKADNVNTKEYVKLSERLAALEGPCRELDVEIYRIANPNHKESCRGVFIAISPKYTGSLDAIKRRIESDFPNLVTAHTQSKINGKDWYMFELIGRGESEEYIGEHESEVIARCIAYVEAKGDE